MTYIQSDEIFPSAEELIRRLGTKFSVGRNGDCACLIPASPELHVTDTEEVAVMMGLNSVTNDINSLKPSISNDEISRSFSIFQETPDLSLRPIGDTSNEDPISRGSSDWALLSEHNGIRLESGNYIARLYIPRQVSTPNSSNTPVSSPLEVALTTPEIVLGFSRNVIVNGTMEGFVNHLLSHPEDVEQHDTFFIGHPACTSSHHILKILIHQFQIASMRTDQTGCMNVLRLICNWLTNQNVIIHNDVLAEMQTFAGPINSPDSLRALALEILEMIRDKAVLNFPLSSVISSSDSNPNNKPTACQLAAALTMLERRRYLNILAAEYISHACSQLSCSPNLQEALALNKSIANWVIVSILRKNNYNDRCNIMRFFVKIAEECRLIRNFSSMSAIMGALQDSSITCLTLTYETIPTVEQRQYQTLATLVKRARESNYRAYREAVHRDAERGCIPWHGVHLHDIDTVLQEQDAEDNNVPPLINFKKWIHLKEKALEALRYRDIPLNYSEDGLELAIAYLESQLQDIPVGDGYELFVRKESARLAQNEGEERRNRTRFSMFTRMISLR